MSQHQTIVFDIMISFLELIYEVSIADQISEYIRNIS